MRRAISVGAGLVLIVIAFVAAAQVADTREGLIAEIITLLAGLAGVGLLLYGLIPKRNPAKVPPPQVTRPASAPKTRSGNDLVLGAGGLVVGAILLAGLAASGGVLWAAIGAALLLPMLAASVYLLLAFARAPQRDWTIDLRRLFQPRAKD